MPERATFRVKRGLAEMLKGGVIMDVTTAEQARIAEDAGAVAVMALERVPADIRAAGGVARMASPRVIKEIQESVTIPVMAKARIGHFAEAQVLESLEVDYIDESEVLTPADEAHHIDKHAFEVPFVCGATNLGEALRRIGEGAAMIRSKGEAGTGNIVEAVRHLRGIVGGIKRLTTLGTEQLGVAKTQLKNAEEDAKRAQQEVQTGEDKLKEIQGKIVNLPPGMSIPTMTEDMNKLKQVQDGKWIVVWPKEWAAPGAKLIVP